MGLGSWFQDNVVDPVADVVDKTVELATLGTVQSDIKDLEFDIGDSLGEYAEAVTWGTMDADVVNEAIKTGDLGAIGDELISAVTLGIADGFEEALEGITLGVSDSEVAEQVTEFIEDPTGAKAAADAAEEAAKIQQEAGLAALEQLRADLAPFVGLGTDAAGQLMGSLLQPQEVPQVTSQDVLSDPFFQALYDEQQRQTQANRAAYGLGTSGGTQDLLTRNLLLLGEDFRSGRQAEASTLQQQQQNEQLARFNQLFNITNLGQASAAQQGLTSADLMTSIGAAQSAVPLANAQANASNLASWLNLAGTVGGYMMGGPVGGAAGSQLGGVLGAGGATYSPAPVQPGSLASYGVY